MAKIIKSTGDVCDTHPKNGTDFKLEELRSVVKGYIEIVYLKDGRLMVVNEEGILEKLPYNHLASMLAKEPIVGDVLVCERGQIL